MVRRFQPPWSVEDYYSKCFIVRDVDGQQLNRVGAGGQAAQQRRGATDRSQYGEVAAVVARLLKRWPRDEVQRATSSLGRYEEELSVTYR